jgi:hypothetical protein
LPANHPAHYTTNRRKNRQKIYTERARNKLQSPPFQGNITQSQERYTLLKGGYVSESAKPADDGAADAEKSSIEIPSDGFSEAAIGNLERLVAAKAWVLPS